MLRCSLFAQDLKDIAVEFQDSICENPIVTHGKLLRTSLATGGWWPTAPTCWEVKIVCRAKCASHD